MGRRQDRIRARGSSRQATILRAARERAGLRQVDIADRLFAIFGEERSQTWVSRLEAGLTTRLGLGEWIQVSAVYGVPLSQLLDEYVLENLPQGAPTFDGLGDGPLAGVEPERVAAGGER